MEQWEVLSGKYTKETIKEAEYIIYIICNLFGIFTNRLQPRFNTYYNPRTNKFKIMFLGTIEEFKTLCKLL